MSKTESPQRSTSQNTKGMMMIKLLIVLLASGGVYYTHYEQEQRKFKVQTFHSITERLPSLRYCRGAIIDHLLNKKMDRYPDRYFFNVDKFMYDVSKCEESAMHLHVLPFTPLEVSRAGMCIFNAILTAKINLAEIDNLGLDELDETVHGYITDFSTKWNSCAQRLFSGIKDISKG
jgi:hypothetical protein